MRLRPVLVLSSAVLAIGVIVAFQAGWLDETGTVPTFVHGNPAIYGAAPARTASVTPETTPSSAAETTSIGRSVGRTAGQTSLKPDGGFGSGGASLDADGVASRPDDKPAAATAADALQQARDEAAKAKQDVLEVTQASLAAQQASEAEFERQKGELNDTIAQMRAKIDAAAARNNDAASDDARTKELEAQIERARQETAALKKQLAVAPPRAADLDDLRRRADAAAQADAKAATASAELADARERETDLRTKLAALQAGGVAAEVRYADKGAADKTASDERALAETQARVEALRAEMATSRSAVTILLAKASAAERAKADLASARQSGDALRGQLAALQAGAEETARARSDADRNAAALRQQLADARLHEQDLGTKLAALRSHVAAGAEETARAKADADRDAAALKQQLADAGLREKDVGSKVAALKSAVAAGAEETARAKADADRDVAALKQKLADAGMREKDLGANVAALQSAIAAKAAPAAKPADTRETARLQDDLAGARRGEDTLRKENTVLARELAQSQDRAKLLGGKLAALQAGMGQPVPPAPKARPDRAKTSRNTRDDEEHTRLTREYEALKTEQMHQEVRALKIEADNMARARRERRTHRDTDQGARFVIVQPLPDARPSSADRHLEHRRGKPIRARDAADETPDQPGRSSDQHAALRHPLGEPDPSRTAIAAADEMIRAGNVDEARQLLARQGNAAATRALADTYNPLTNSQYGVIGVDSDADKAAYLYKRAAQAGR